MKERTIAGDIRRIRRLMRYTDQCAFIGKSDYGRFLELLDSIETKAKMMQEEIGQTRKDIGEIRRNILETESMPSAPLDGAMENQRINGEKLVAKVNFYDFVKGVLFNGKDE